jgi:hypothetical protein
MTLWYGVACPKRDFWRIFAESSINKININERKFKDPVSEFLYRIYKELESKGQTVHLNEVSEQEIENKALDILVSDSWDLMDLIIPDNLFYFSLDKGYILVCIDITLDFKVYPIDNIPVKKENILDKFLEDNNITEFKPQIYFTRLDKPYASELYGATNKTKI